MREISFEHTFLAIAILIALTLSFEDNLLAPIGNIFIQIFTLDSPSPIFPFTIAVAFLTFAVALISSRSLTYSLSLPFAFLGLYELFWHVIPGSSPIDPLGIGVVLSWAMIGFASIKKWKADGLTFSLIALELLCFGLWYLIGFSETSAYSVVMNIVTKVLLGAIFIQIFYHGLKIDKLALESKSRLDEISIGTRAS